MTSGPGRLDVVFAASGGGHLELLADARDVVSRERRAWVTVAGSRADALRGEGELVCTVPPLDRQNLTVRNFWPSVRLARALAPKVVVTSGAGVVLGFAGAARLQGARVVFVETMARVTSPSLSGRAFARLAGRTIVQWPELLNRYPRARLCRPTLLPRTVPQRSGAGAGTFVSVGTHPKPFHRLLLAVESAAARGVLPAPVLAQIGESRFTASSVQTRTWMSRAEFQQAMVKARVVIGHCGAGLLGTAIGLGHRPLVLPRLGKRQEHVDEHQSELFRKLSELDLIVPITERITPELVARAQTADFGRELFADAIDLEDVLAQELSGWSVG